MKRPKSPKLQRAVSSSSALHAIKHIPRDTKTLAFLLIIHQKANSRGMRKSQHKVATVVDFFANSLIIAKSLFYCCPFVFLSLCRLFASSFCRFVIYSLCCSNTPLLRRSLLRCSIHLLLRHSSLCCSFASSIAPYRITLFSSFSILIYRLIHGRPWGAGGWWEEGEDWTTTTATTKLTFRI